VDNSKRGASWERVAAEFKSERDALKGDVLRMQQERDDALEQLAIARRGTDDAALTAALVRILKKAADTGEPKELTSVLAEIVFSLPVPTFTVGTIPMAMALGGEHWEPIYTKVEDAGADRG
jgi:hypothetical protein